MALLFSRRNYMGVLNDDVILQISKEENIKVEQIKSVLEMLEDEKTVAFIARYRKEVTGGLDEEKIRAISDAYDYGCNLAKRTNYFKGYKTNKEFEDEISNIEKLKNQVDQEKDKENSKSRYNSTALFEFSDIQ